MRWHSADTVSELTQDPQYRPAVGAIYLLSEHPPPGVTAVINLTRREHLAHHEGPTYLDLQSAPAGSGSVKAFAAWHFAQLRRSPG